MTDNTTVRAIRNMNEEDKRAEHANLKAKSLNAAKKSPDQMLRSMQAATEKFLEQLNDQMQDVDADHLASITQIAFDVDAARDRHASNKKRLLDLIEKEDAELEAVIAASEKKRAELAKQHEKQKSVLLRMIAAQKAAADGMADELPYIETENAK